MFSAAVLHHYSVLGPADMLLDKDSGCVLTYQKLVSGRVCVSFTNVCCCLKNKQLSRDCELFSVSMYE